MKKNRAQLKVDTRRIIKKDMSHTNTTLIYWILLITLPCSFLIDKGVALFFSMHAIPVVTYGLQLITLLGSIIVYSCIIGILLAYSFVKKKELLPLMIGVIATQGIIQLLKILINRPRPFMELSIPALTTASGGSFPSGHSAAVFFLVPFLNYRIPKLKPLWWMLAILVAISRVYLGVHYVSDVLFGAIIGFLIGYYCVAFEMQRKGVHWFELRRKLAHIIIGLVIAVLISIGYLTWQIALIITLCGLVLVIITRKQGIPLITPILLYIDRPQHQKNIPGRGALFMMIAVTLLLAFTPKMITLAALMIWIVGDSLSAIIGIHHGRIKHPITARYLEGTIAAIAISAILASFFVPIMYAFIAAIIALGLESLELHIGRMSIEDNLLVPLVSAAVLLIIVLI